MALSDHVSWNDFLDGVVERMRLQSAARQADLLLVALHMISSVWGEVLLFRAAERLVRRHHVDLDTLLSAGPSAFADEWFKSLLRGGFDVVDPAPPLPPEALKPAWIADGEARS